MTILGLSAHVNHRKFGLLLTSLAVVIFNCVLPFLRPAGPVTNASHFVMGLALGTGLAMMIGALLKQRRGSPCKR
jgi:hypothetical protein